MSQDNVSLQDVLEAVNTGFQTMEDRFQGLGEDLGGRMGGLETRMDKLETSMERVEGRVNQVWYTVEKWPDPSAIHDLSVRVKYVEGKLNIKPGEAFGH